MGAARPLQPVYEWILRNKYCTLQAYLVPLRGPDMQRTWKAYSGAAYTWGVVDTVDTSEYQWI